VGIGCTGHGASLAYLRRDGVTRSSVLDRWTGIKNTLLFAEDEDRAIRARDSDTARGLYDMLAGGFGRFPETRTFEQTIHSWFDWLVRGLDVQPEDVDLVVTSESHFATCRWRLGGHLNRWFPAAEFFSDIEHHGVHQRQAFWQSGFQEAAVLTLDTSGEGLERLGGRQLAGTIARFRQGHPPEVMVELLYPDSSAGRLYDLCTHHVGFLQGEQGKTMGLASYGGPDLFERLHGDLELRDDGSFRFLPPEEFQAALETYVAARRGAEPITREYMDVAYAGQALIERIVANAFQAALARTGLQDLAYAGGLALNSVANEVAWRESGPHRLYIAPNAGDTGHALGCALFGAYELSGWPPPGDELPEYLGPPYTLEEMEAAARASGLPVHRPDPLEPVAARALADGKVVARFDGPAEFGPRALGNRSILCDPRGAGMKDHLNARVKHRESFRPFAPTVLDRHAAEWFSLGDRSAYMLRVAAVHEQARDLIPAVVHVDGSARVQTLSAGENPGYWRLLRAWYELSGIPLVLNTSFNLAGKPLVETPADAVECFLSTAIDLLLLGPFLLAKEPLR
jgi:carbamoyltransferase